jgi:excisionase family DNA binding protein
LLEKSLPEEVLTASQAAQFLHVHPKTIYRLIAERRIPFIRKPGLGYRFLRSELMQWLKQDLTIASGWRDAV